MSVQITVDKVTFRYPREDQNVLHDVSLTIQPGDFFGLLGPNGAGKTTLMSLLTGILSPDDGSVKFRIGGIELKISERRLQTGYVPQEFAFYPELTALQNLAYFGAMYNLNRLEIRERSEELLQLLGLARTGKKKVGAFSGGMKRRINLAIGILHRPSVLLLDEPTVGVDAQSRNAILNFLKQLNESGTTIVYTSHHLAEAEELCNRVTLLDQGRVIANDDLPALLKSGNYKDLQSLFLQLTGAAYRD